jgi:hypothetical protein
MELDVRSVGECLVDNLLHLIEHGMPEDPGNIFPLKHLLRASSSEAD